MKDQIKSLRGKFVRLDWKINGYDHSMTGTIKNPKIVQFDFMVNGVRRVKIRFENVKNVELIK